MDTSELRRDCPFVLREVQRQKMLSRLFVHTFAQMQQETRFALEPREELLRTLGFHISDARLGFGQVLVVRLLDIAHDSTVEASDAGVAEERDPLTRRYTTDETLRLDKADEGRNKPW